MLRLQQGMDNMNRIFWLCLLLVFASCSVDALYSQSKGGSGVPYTGATRDVYLNGNNLTGARSPGMGTTYQTVAANGITRAIKYLNSAGVVTGVYVFNDTRITDQRDPAVVGSLG